MLTHVQLMCQRERERKREKEREKERESVSVERMCQRVNFSLIFVTEILIYYLRPPQKLSNFFADSILLNKIFRVAHEVDQTSES